MANPGRGSRATAFMVLPEVDIVRLMAGRTEWKGYLHEEGQWRQVAGAV